MSFIVSVDGSFGNWSEWSTCDATCGGGIQQRYRTCTNPSPSHGGRDCLTANLGPSMVTQSCNINECPGKLHLNCVFLR